MLWVARGVPLLAMALEPPPPAFYGDRHELIQAVKEWAGAHGYAATIRNSNERKGFVYIACDCSGRLKDCHRVTPATRHRVRGSRRDNCPFLVIGRRSAGLWGVVVRNAAHNHGPTSPSAHPSLRRLTTGQQELVNSLTKVGVRPSQIEAQLQETRATAEELPLLARDIYNIRHQQMRESLDGRTPIQALLLQFAADDFVWEYKLDTEGHVTHLFFASHRSLHLFLLYPEVLLLDCTYKTNRFGMPLLNMVGITGVKLSFLVGCAFIQSEGEEDFCWVLECLLSHISSPPGVVVTDCDFALLNALQRAFPSSHHILCRWHVRRSIQTRCKSHFSSRRASNRQGTCVLASQQPLDSLNDSVKDFMSDWDDVVFSEDVATYRMKWRKLQSNYRRESLLVDYLRTTWMPLKEHFMAPWVDEWLHLGATETSRVEGFHSVLKHTLSVSV